MTTTRIPVSVCPVCSYDVGPAPGDFSVCMSCGEILTFDQALKLAVPTITHLIDLQQDTEREHLLLRAQQMVRRERLLQKNRRSK